jgi:hypothetical protein
LWGFSTFAPVRAVVRPPPSPSRHHVSGNAGDSVAGQRNKETKMCNNKNVKKMTSAEKFSENTYERLKKAITEISGVDTKDVYALSFWYCNENDDFRYPTINVSYNTTQQFLNETKNASNETEAKWNYAYWLQNEIEMIGGQEDELLAKWFVELPYYYSDEEDREASKDDELFDRLIEKGQKLEKEFIEVIISLTQRLFDEKVIELKFGKNIPVLVHELEYYDKPINWTKRANPPEVIEEFLNVMNDEEW